MPELIQFRNGSQILNSYDAAGTKFESRFITCLVTTVVPLGDVSNIVYGIGINRIYKENKTYYCNNYEYAWNSSGSFSTRPLLSKIHNSEGYKDGQDINSDILHYFRRDHLGNVREVWKSGSPAQTVQRMQYYPSGLPWADCMGADYQNRKYNGKEFIEMHGLNEYDSYARWYYPAIMRTTTMDVLCEKYYSISPYAWCGNNPVRYIDPDGMDWFEYTDKDGNTQTIWRKSQEKTYKDDSGNIWNNIGENYLSINGDNATLFTQHKNDKGELYLRSSSYNLADEKSTNRLTSTLGDILSKGDAVAGALGGYAEGSKATFRLTNSKGKFDFKFYGNGWKGNQWVTPSSVSNLGKSVGNLGKMLGGLGILASAYQFRQASTLEGQLEHGLDVFMGGMGFVPVVGTGISLYWSFGGKKLHNMYVNKVLIPQIQMGINPGLPVYQPFK